MESAIIVIVIIMFSAIIHEVMHGYAADRLGDPTARYAGRLTLNPIPHLDPVGSILLPLIFALSPGSFFFGWAKPVPYNPYNLSNQRWGPGLVAAVGPLSNLLVALVFGIAIRFSTLLPASTAGAFVEISTIIVILNIVLAVFNLVPIPPLDGSKVLFAFLPYHLAYIEEFLERYGIVLLLIFIFFFFDMLYPVVTTLFRVFTGGGAI